MIHAVAWRMQLSLNFGHYFLKEGTYTLIGAETAQALPNNQVYYAFIRGAGKQYGVPWFGNASVWNRWGYKTYGAAGGSGGETHSPTNGTSLSLMKRLLYSHVLYNCVAVGFESGWFDGEQLSPIGRIQQAAQQSGIAEQERARQFQTSETVKATTLPSATWKTGMVSSNSTVVT